MRVPLSLLSLCLSLSLSLCLSLCLCSLSRARFLPLDCSARATPSSVGRHSERVRVTSVLFSSSSSSRALGGAQRACVRVCRLREEHADLVILRGTPINHHTQLGRAIRTGEGDRESSSSTLSSPTTCRGPIGGGLLGPGREDLACPTWCAAA